MAKTANINIRIEPETKATAEKLFSSFGITITDAINIFLNKSIMEGGLPFELKQLLIPLFHKFHPLFIFFNWFQTYSLFDVF